MQVQEINPVKTPHLFYPKKDTGEVDEFDKPIFDFELFDTKEINEKSEPIYARSPSIEIPFAEGKTLRKMAVDESIQDLHVYNNSTKLYRDDVLVCESKLYMDKLIDKWINYNFGVSEVILDAKTLLAAKVVDVHELKITAEFEGGDPKTERINKQTFFLKGEPTDIIRARWYLKAYTLEDLIVDYSDYKGSTSDTDWIEQPGYWERTIIFEPDGVLGELTVDPYLSVDEQATYVDVTCDGFTARVYSGGSEAFLGKIYDSDAVGTDDWFTFGSKVDVGGTTYCISEDTGITLEIIESTPARVVLRAVGDFETSGQASLADESGSSVYLYIYPDKIIQRTTFNATASITLADSAVNGLCFMDSVVANLANEDSKYENSGSESDAGSDGVQSGADYIVILADECNVQGIMLEATLGGGTGTYVQYIDDPGVALRFGWNNGTVTTESTMTVCWIIDSVEREGAAKLYNSTDRLAIGDDKKDMILTDPNPGDAVTDLNIPESLDG